MEKNHDVYHYDTHHVLVAAFNIVSMLVMVVTEKQSDIAILRYLRNHAQEYNGNFYGTRNDDWFSGDFARRIRRRFTSIKS